jgi:hypothetical protein
MPIKYKNNSMVLKKKNQLAPPSSIFGHIRKWAWCSPWELNSVEVDFPRNKDIGFWYLFAKYKSLFLKQNSIIVANGTSQAYQFEK